MIAEIEAIDTDALLDLEDQGVRVIPNANAVKTCMNRMQLRKLAAEKVGVPTTRYAFASDEEEARRACKEVGFPCLLKPEMSSSGHGHVLVKSEDEVEKGFRESVSHARGKSRTVIVEEYVKVDTELTVLTYRHMNNGSIETKTLEPIEHQRPSYYYVESWQPSTVSQEVIARSREYATRVVNELGGLGIFGVEIIVSGTEYFSVRYRRGHMIQALSPWPVKTSVSFRFTLGQHWVYLYLR